MILLVVSLMSHTILSDHSNVTNNKTQLCFPCLFYSDLILAKHNGQFS